MHFSLQCICSDTLEISHGHLLITKHYHLPPRLSSFGIPEKKSVCVHCPFDTDCSFSGFTKILRETNVHIDSRNAPHISHKDNHNIKLAKQVPLLRPGMAMLLVCWWAGWEVCRCGVLKSFKIISNMLAPANDLQTQYTKLHSFGCRTVWSVCIECFQLPIFGAHCVRSFVSLLCHILFMLNVSLVRLSKCVCVRERANDYYGCLEW